MKGADPPHPVSLFLSALIGHTAPGVFPLVGFTGNLSLYWTYVFFFFSRDLLQMEAKYQQCPGTCTTFEQALFAGRTHRMQHGFVEVMAFAQLHRVLLNLRVLPRFRGSSSRPLGRLPTGISIRDDHSCRVMRTLLHQALHFSSLSCFGFSQRATESSAASAGLATTHVCSASITSCPQKRLALTLQVNMEPQQ